MSEKLQIRIGSHAPDRLDAERLQETVVYHWHRIALALVLCLTLLSGAGAGAYYWLHSNGSAPVKATAGISPPAPSAAGSGSEVTPVSGPVPEPATSAPAAGLVTSGRASAPAGAGERRPMSVQSTSRPVGTAVAASPAPRSAHGPASPADLPAPTLTARVPRLQLTSGLKGKLPADDLGGEIDLAGRSIIRVYLYSRLKDLKGQLIYHEWFDGNRRVARIGIRPYLQTMNASTSKYLTPAMTGPWTVRVVDGRGRVLGERHFRVVDR